MSKSPTRKAIDTYLPGIPRKIEPPQPLEFIRPLKSFASDPVTGWLTLKHNSETFGALFEKYVFYLAAIPAVAGYIGYVVFGSASPLYGIAVAVSGYIICISLTYGATYLAERTVRMFDGQMTLDESAKLVVYSFMPVYLCGIFLALPPLRPFMVAGVWGLFLFWKGLPTMTHIPKRKQLTYFSINVVSWMVYVDLTSKLLP